jgi:hypothetical protein
MFYRADKMMMNWRSEARRGNKSMQKKTKIETKGYNIKYQML